MKQNVSFAFKLCLQIYVDASYKLIILKKFFKKKKIGPTIWGQIARLWKTWKGLCAWSKLCGRIGKGIWRCLWAQKGFKFTWVLVYVYLCFQSHKFAFCIWKCHTWIDVMFNVNDMFVSTTMNCLSVNIFLFHFLSNMYKFLLKVAKSLNFWT